MRERKTSEAERGVMCLALIKYICISPRSPRQRRSRLLNSFFHQKYARCYGFDWQTTQTEGPAVIDRQQVVIKVQHGCSALLFNSVHINNNLHSHRAERKELRNDTVQGQNMF